MLLLQKFFLEDLGDLFVVFSRGGSRRNPFVVVEIGKVERLVEAVINDEKITNLGGLFLACISPQVKTALVDPVCGLGKNAPDIDARSAKIERGVEDGPPGVLAHPNPFMDLGDLAGQTWRANFYKCADASVFPHWLTWSRVGLPEPDFHQPAFFGTLEFA